MTLRRAHLHRFAVVLLLLVASPVTAGLFDDEEARAQVADLKKQVGEMHKALEARVVSLETALQAQGLLDLLNQVEAMKGDLAKLHGQIEVLAHELEQAHKRQRDLYVDLDTRLRKIETPAPAVTETAGAPVEANTPPPLPASNLPSVAPTPIPKLPPTRTAPEAGVTPEQQAYATAMDQFQAGKYQEALALFQAFLKAFPKSPLAPSAQYWIGNAHFALREFPAAIAAQRLLIRNYPDSQKVPDAWLNIASAQAEQGDISGAKKSLEDLVARYPQSEAAEKAKKRLAAAH